MTESTEPAKSLKARRKVVGLTTRGLVPMQKTKPSGMTKLQECRVWPAANGKNVTNKRKMLGVALCLGLSTAAAIAAFTGCAGNQNASRSGQYIDDKALQRQVRVALENNPGYEFSEVKVDVHSGAVQLSGLVDTPDQKSKASEVAENVQSVTTVTNNITLLPAKDY
jgi:hypothetical protein